MDSVKAAGKHSDVGTVKCLVWDLDETLWDGTLLEGGRCTIIPEIMNIVRELDSRGILQSVASKNDYELAWSRLKELGVAEFFLAPQIGWGGKAKSIEMIAGALGIATDAIAFIDDQRAERDEVAYFLPQVKLLAPSDIPGILSQPEFTPRQKTKESSHRRAMYQADISRKAAEDGFEGTRDVFLATLDMRMIIRKAHVSDLERADELTVRTNQLNSTGITYSFEELEYFSQSDDHILLVAELEDRYGRSGIIGLSLIETGNEVWRIRLLIMSCRVLTRGVGTVMLGQILRRAKQNGRRLQADFVPTDRNRQMLITYKFAGFIQASMTDHGILLQHDLVKFARQPAYVDVIDEDVPI
jgi:FkbH-like protein